MKLHERLVEDLTHLIREGVLRPGDHMPSVRKLAHLHSVSSGTVLQPYGSLEDRDSLKLAHAQVIS